MQPSHIVAFVPVMARTNTQIFGHGTKDDFVAHSRDSSSALGEFSHAVGRLSEYHLFAVVACGTGVQWNRRRGRETHRRPTNDWIL